MASAQTTLSQLTILCGDRVNNHLCRNSCSGLSLELLLTDSRWLAKGGAGPTCQIDPYHSDNEKFYNALNNPQGCEMSEWPLSVL